MSKEMKRAVYRAGIATLGALLLVLGVMVIGIGGWQAWKYFSNPAAQVVTTQNINGVIHQTTSSVRINRSVRDYFSLIATDWRPTKQVFAMENGKAIEKYEAHLPPGQLRLEKFDEEFKNPSDERGPAVNGTLRVDTPLADMRVGTSFEVQGQSPTEQVYARVKDETGAEVVAKTVAVTNEKYNDRIDLVTPVSNIIALEVFQKDDSGTELNRICLPLVIDKNVNDNVNASPNTLCDVSIDVNANSNANVPVNANTNQAPDTNVNSPTTNANVTVNTNENVNEPTNENKNTAPVNTNQPVNDNVNTPTENVNQAQAEVNTSVPEANVNVSASPEPVAEVVPADEWRGRVPRGHGFLQANWFCSAAYSHLFLVRPDGSTIPLGDFTGDCTNPAVVVKGNFLPQELPDVDLTQPLNFRIITEWYDGNHTNETATNPDLCVVDYIRGAGHRDVYAAQYTCDEGLGGAAQDDLQFTVYAFPGSWTFPANREDLFTADELKSDEDGDGLTLQRELKLGTNPNHWDTDNDNLGDFEEVEKYQTDPTKADTDSDGFRDYVEVNGGYNPLGPGTATAEQLAAWAAAPNQVGKPVITNVTAEVSGESVVVSWDVNPAADGIVNYGSSDAYGTYVNNYAFVTHHSLTFPGNPGQAVHYAIRSCTPAPNAACATTNDAVVQGP